MMTKTKHKLYEGGCFRPTEQDHLLWQKVAATVRPLLPEKRQKTVGIVSDLDQAVVGAMLGAGDTAPVVVPQRAVKIGKPDQSAKSENHVSMELCVSKLSVGKGGGISRKAQRKISRHYFDHGARLDLHGARQGEAYDLLLHFLRANAARNQTLVLVITGKGGRRDGMGILRQLVPQWLETAPFRHYVGAVEVAAQPHGGEGAFYVRLRRNMLIGS